jgi:hypothetical protein
MQQQQKPQSSQQQQAEIPGSRPVPAPRFDAALDVVWIPPQQQG